MKSEQIKAWISSIAFVICVVGLGVIFFLLPDKDISVMERRRLKQSPQWDIATILDGSIFDEYEMYMQDQFPMRESLRTLKAVSEYFCFAKSDNNNIYICDGYVCKQDYPLDSDAVIEAADKCNKLYDKLFDGKDSYYSIIPDKNYYLAEKSGHLSYEYQSLFTIMKNNIDGRIKYIGIADLLSINQFYKTDIHWKQETVVPIADRMMIEMGETPPMRQYEKKTLFPFYGAYFGQAALPISADKLVYLTNKALDKCIVYNPIKNESCPLYDLAEFGGIDSYNLFTGGSESLLFVDNPSNNSGKELYIIRDSFASGIVPLLIENYTRIVLIDPRYISSDVVSKYISVGDNATVLYMISTTILNKGYLFK